MRCGPMQLSDLSSLYKTLQTRPTLAIERSYTACTLAPHATVVVDGWSMATVACCAALVCRSVHNTSAACTHSDCSLARKAALWSLPRATGTPERWRFSGA